MLIYDTTHFMMQHNKAWYDMACSTQPNPYAQLCIPGKQQARDAQSQVMLQHDGT